ncbi:hypothetical protein ACIA8C_27400 [Nocardia sp. NPDC051321]|uniref:LppU/SCO3897 family protein n=1 Tax=Nocardia sp. NPDC051321 TaxID=3364323 RepID=UPI003794EE75
MSQGFPPPTETEDGATGLEVVVPVRRKPWHSRWIGKLAVLGVGVAVCLVVGVFLNMKSAPGEAKITAGSCAKVWGATSAAELAQADCADPDANYRVALRVDNDIDTCPSPDYAYYKRSGPDGYRLCLTLNAAENDCFADLPGFVGPKAACGPHSYQVSRIVHGTMDRLLCGVDTRAQWGLVYSTPEPTTICVRAVGR